MISGMSNVVGDKISNTVAGAFVHTNHICPKCGTENRQESKFCKKCGSTLEKNTEYCTNCGEKLDADSDFCSICGKKVN